ncbi:DUF423 domain-containing protein [Flavicella sediminum]|uniref:DUF423 domain-containing protein n=1 Tax=Flavicella sediminum TaxID=2585141 RepID=UPI001120A521|nr:DUF423 domain-containing protein [Flavicella sediminum]
MNKLLSFSIILGAIGIILGAFGAHALKGILTEQSMASFETGVRYQMYHVLLLVGVNLATVLSDRTKKQVSSLILLGIFFFSGSIYAITVAGIPAKSIWFVTPLGGLLFIIGWILLAVRTLNEVRH